MDIFKATQSYTSNLQTLRLESGDRIHTQAVRHVVETRDRKSNISSMHIGFSERTLCVTYKVNWKKKHEVIYMIAGRSYLGCRGQTEMRILYCKIGLFGCSPESSTGAAGTF